MIHDKLEDQYAYKGNEKFLREVEIHRTLYISILVYLYIFLTLSFYIITKGSYIDLNFINNYITLNIGNNNTFFGDLKNASLYLFAAQATLIGLIFPIVIAFVSLANVGKASSDKLINIYKTHTGFNILANSSFLLLAFYACLFILDSFFNIFLFKASQFLFLPWFIFNLYLIYIFLSKTINFTYSSKKIKEITKYSYNYENGIRDGFLIIADELNYFLESKSISRAQDLEIDLVEFLKTIYIKHKFKQEDMDFFLDEIRKIIDNTLDYNNAHSIRKILYIYYYLGRRLNNIETGVFLNKLLEMHYIVLFDLNNKLNISNDYKDYVYSIFLNSWDSWNAWNQILINNVSKSFYNYHTFMVISFYIQHDRKIESILDTLLRIPENIQINWLNRKKYKTFTDKNDICNESFLNLCIDTKLCIVKNILESNYDLHYKKTYIKSLLNNSSLLHGTTGIRSDTRVENAKDLIFSILRIISSSYYSDYLNNMLDKSKPSNRVSNRMYWMDTSSYLSKISETYAYIYDQFITNKSFPTLAINDYLTNFDINEKTTLLNNINNYIIELENFNFIYNFFDDNRKIKLIKRRYIGLILQLRDQLQLNIIDYYSRFKLSITDKNNIFYSEFQSIYYYLRLSIFSEFIVWKNTIKNSNNINFNYNMKFIDPNLIIDIDVVYTVGHNILDEDFIKDTLNHANRNEIKSKNPLSSIFDFIKSNNSEELLILIFCSTFFDDIKKYIEGFNFISNGFNTYTINGVCFRFVGNYGFNFYAAIFNKNMIKSIDILYGNKTFEKSSITLISSPPPEFNLYYKINYDFTYKMNFDLDYSLYLFLKS